MIDPTQDNLIQPLSFNEILDNVKISKDHYFRVLSKSKDEDLKLHLEREPYSCFSNNYLDVGLKALQTNLYIQPVSNEYKAVTYMCQYLSKTEDPCSKEMKQAAKEVFESNMHHNDTMKTIAKACLFC